MLSPPLAPHIQPPYYGALVATDTLGTSGAPRISELDINNGAVSGYALFDAGAQTVSRVLLINFNIFTTADTQRGSVNVTLSFDSTSPCPKKASVKTLEIPYAPFSLLYSGYSQLILVLQERGHQDRLNGC